LPCGFLYAPASPESHTDEPVQVLQVQARRSGCSRKAM